MNLQLGYRYSAGYARIRKVKKEDAALIVSDSPAACAATFTTNRVVAAPVELARKHLRASGGCVRVLIVNAGNANCATRTGKQAALECVKAAAAATGAKIQQVLPASTGVIGVELDAKRIVDAMPGLAAGLNAARFGDAAAAIMTTDTFPKMACAEVAGARIAGMTKGAGMIHPRMATTLGFVMTDAVVPLRDLRSALKRGIAA